MGCMEIRVSGSLPKVQSSLDFYLQLTSVGKRSMLDLRKEYFSQFLSEELERREQSNIEVSREPTEGKNKLNTSVVEDIEYVASGRFVDEEVSKETIEERIRAPEDNIIYVSEGRCVEDITTEREDNSPVRSTEESSVEVDYVPHGRYVDDSPAKTVEVSYVPHGKYVDEDFADEEDEVEFEFSDEDEEEDVQVESDTSEEGQYKFAEEEDFYFDDENEEPFEFVDEEVEDSEEGYELSNEEKPKEGISVSYEEDEEPWDSIEEDEPEDVEEDILQVDVSPEPPKVETVPRFRSEVSMEDEGSASKDVPADLREFLRQHPCSPIEYVLKFYPKKEIDKQLALGRVYKKKGKLMI